MRKHEINFITYDTETRELTLRLSISRFNGSKRVRGSSIGAPPKEAPPGPPPPAGRPPWKYSLLERDWVAWSTHAPTPTALRAAFPGLAAWAHW